MINYITTFMAAGEEAQPKTSDEGRQQCCMPGSTGKLRSGLMSMNEDAHDGN
jgi:hypothetical protein